MLLQNYTTEEKNALKELRKTLNGGTATRIVAEQSDASLQKFLLAYQRKRNLAWYLVVPCLPLILFQIAATVGYHFHLWSFPHYPYHLLMVPSLLFWKYMYQIKPEGWKLIESRLESAALSTLLDIRRLRISQLSPTVQTEVIKRLAVATTDELETLTSKQRMELVRFTLTQIHQRQLPYRHGASFLLSQERNQAAIAGFLALATLRQRGTEQITPDTVSESRINLRRAIEEYHFAMKASS